MGCVVVSAVRWLVYWPRAGLLERWEPDSKEEQWCGKSGDGVSLSLGGSHFQRVYDVYDAEVVSQILACRLIFLVFRFSSSLLLS